MRIPLAGGYWEIWQETPSQSEFHFNIRSPLEVEEATLALYFIPDGRRYVVSVVLNGNSLGAETRNPDKPFVVFYLKTSLLKKGPNVLELSQYVPSAKDYDVGGRGFDYVEISYHENAVPASVPGGYERYGSVTPDFSPFKTVAASGFVPVTYSPSPPSGYDSILDEEGDYLIISNNYASSSLNPLKNRRASEGFTVREIDVDDIYAVFTQGGKDARIKDFIVYAHTNWTLKPKYVLLIGSGMDDTPGVPEHIEEVVSFSEMVDDWYVDLNDGLLPKIAIGRIPGDTGAEVSNAVSKIISFEDSKGQNWTNDLLLTKNAYWHQPGGAGSNFVLDDYFLNYLTGMGSDIESYFTGMEITSYSTDSYGGSPNSWYKFKDEIDEGKGCVLFLGNGQWHFLGHTLNDIYIEPPENKTGRVADLSNTGKYPIIVAGTCYGGHTCEERYEIEVIAKSCLVNFANKGASAVISAGGKAIYYPHWRLFGEVLASTLSKAPENGRLGDLLTEAKIKATENDEEHNPAYYRGNQLLGDPAMKVIFADYFPVLLPGWPHLSEGYGSMGPSAVGDLEPELSQGFPGTQPPFYVDLGQGYDVTVTDTHLMVSLDRDASVIEKYNVRGTEGIVVVGDIDSEGRFDLIEYSPSGVVRAFDCEGDLLPGFPVSLNENIGSAPAVGDINGDGYLDIVVATDTKVHVINYDGTEFTGGWPANLQTDYWPVGSPAVGDIDYDGNLEVVVGTSCSYHNSNISVFDKNGNVKSGWAFPVGFLGSELITPPALADLTGDGPLEIVVASTKYPNSPRKGYYHVFSHNGPELVNELLDGYSFDFTPSVGEFIPWPEYPGKEAVLVGYNGYDSDILLIEADDGSVENTIFTNGKFITGAPTIGDVDNFGANEVVVGCEDYLMAYCLDWGGVPFDGEWDGSLNGAVSTPIITDLNGDGLSDIVCGDSDGVYAFTTNRMYLPLTGFDWVRENHDNMNMGLWDIAAPTGVVAEDIPNDQGGSVVVAWSHSVDVGVRSSRVAKYKIYRKVGDIIPPGGDAGPLAGGAVRRKLAEGKRAAASSNGAVVRPASLNSDAPSPARLADTGEPTDDLFVHIATVLPPDYYYIDEGLDNLRTYEYHVVATDYDETYRSQPSVTVSVVPHDNIAPAPPTNFDLDIIHGQPPAVLLMWTRSFDDPMYHSGQGEPTDNTRGRVIAGRFVPPGVASPVPAGTAVPAAGGSAAASAASYDGGAGASGAYAYAGSPGAPTFLSDKQGEAAKIKFASRRGLADNYGTTGPRPSAPTDGGFDDGADDVNNYCITKDSEQFYCYPVTPGNDVEYLDEEVAYGNIYYYWIKAKDSENYSEEVGPIIADLTDIPDAGPLAYGPDSPLAGDPYRGAVDGGAAAASPYAEIGRGACGTKPARVITCKPNPVTGTATFTITLPAACPVTLDVYDLAGRRVDTVLRKTVREGGETVLWQPAVPTGVYIYRLETPKRQYSGKVVVAR